MIKMTFDPNHPYIFFHPQFLWKFEGRWWEYKMTREDFDKRWWHSQDCFAIDVDCRKFPLLMIFSCGTSWTWPNLFMHGRRRLLEIRHIFGEPTELTFEQARDQFVEFVCQRRWWSASYETEKQFRARNAAYTSMRELMEPVGLKGKSLSELR